MISIFLFVVITTLIRLKFSIPPRQMYWCNYIIWHHQFSHRNYLLDNLGVSTGIIVRWMFGFDYYVSNIYRILFCYYFHSDVSIQIPKLCIFFKSILQQKKLWYPGPQSLLQCKCLICHHGGQLIPTHFLLCYYLFLLSSYINIVNTVQTVCYGRQR